MLGLLGMILKPFAKQDWSLQTSIRAAFYVMGVLISWMLLTTAVIDLVQLKAENGKNMSFLYGFAVVPAIATFVWMYTGFFRQGGTISWVRSGVLALAMFALIFLPVFILELICLLYTSPSPRDLSTSRMPSSA